jgi:hypothetical protein
MVFAEQSDLYMSQGWLDIVQSLVRLFGHITEQECKRIKYASRVVIRLVNNINGINDFILKRGDNDAGIFQC